MTIMQETLGSFLKKARETKKLSLEEASFKTKIKSHYLAAFEANNLSALPSKVQGKGFLRIYAEFLELDETQVLTAWTDPNLLVPVLETPVTEVEEAPTEDEATITDTIENTTNAINDSEIEDAQPAEDASSQEQYFHFEPTEEPSIPEAESLIPTAPSQEKFTQIGKTLKEHRESLHLSIEEIEKFTSIRAHYLTALENGNLDELPSPVQGRGMLNNYAKFLNLNHDDLLLSFAEGLQLRREEMLAPEQHQKTSNKEKSPATQALRLSKKYLSFDFIITIVLIVGIFGIILFAAAQIAAPEASFNPTDPPSISDVLLQETEGTPATATPTLIVSTGDEGITLENPGVGAEATALPEGTFPLNVYIISQKRAFLRVLEDDQVAFDGRTVPGLAYEFSAESQIELLTGSAAALEIYFNQEPLGNIGGIGEIASLIFSSSQGVITPTPRYSPTPTSTELPTETPTPTITPTPTNVQPTPTVTPYIP